MWDFYVEMRYNISSVNVLICGEYVRCNVSNVRYNILLCDEGIRYKIFWYKMQYLSISNEYVRCTI